MSVDITSCRIPASPCGEMEGATYRGDNVDISVSVQRDRVHEENGEDGEIVLAKPLCARHSELLGDAVLFLG